MYNEKVISEFLVTGTALTNETFTKGKKHSFEMPKYEVRDNINTLGVIDSLKNAINNKCKKNSSIALQLSGGKDSRTLVALMADLGLHPICLTYSYDKTNTEFLVAKKICKKLNLEHIFIKIKPQMYINDNEAKEITNITHGNPSFYSLSLFYAMREKLDYDIIFNGNLMTEIMDTREYHWYNGDIKDSLIKKSCSKILPLVNNHAEIANNYTHMLSSYSLNDVILSVNWNRLLYLKVWEKLGINFCCPILNYNVLSDVFSLPIKERINSKLTRNIVKLLNPELYNISMARSPLSMKYPLWVHQAYAKMSGRHGGKGFDVAKFISNNMDVENLKDIDLDFLNHEGINSCLKNSDTKWNTIKRLRNLKMWMETINNG